MLISSGGVVDLNSPDFIKADEEYRRKIREDKYGPPGAGMNALFLCFKCFNLNAPSSAPAVVPIREATYSGIEAQFFQDLNEARSNPSKACLHFFSSRNHNIFLKLVLIFIFFLKVR